MASELQVAADRWAARLGCPLAVFDEADELVIHSAHRGGPIDEVRLSSILRREPVAAVRELIPTLDLPHRTEPFRAPLPAHLGMQPRVVVPLRAQGRYLGTVWISDPDGVLADLSPLRDAAEELSQLLHEDRYPGTQRDLGSRRRATRAVRDLVEDDRGQDEAAWQMLAEAVAAPSGAVLTVVVSRRRGLPRDALRGGEARWRGTADALLALDGPERALWALVTPPTQASSRAEALAAALRQQSAGVVSGASGPVGWGGDLRESALEADDAARAALALPELEGLAWWPRLGVVALALRLGRAGPGLWRRVPGTDRLDALSEETLRTLEAYLDLAGDAQATAARLSTHRATVYYRLNKAQTVLDLSLDDGGVRTGLHLALKARRLAPPGEDWLDT